VYTTSRALTSVGQRKKQKFNNRMNINSVIQSLFFFFFFFFPVPVCAMTASGVPGGAFVSMNRFSTLCA
jgi:hypothetical protein